MLYPERYFEYTFPEIGLHAGHFNIGAVNIFTNRNLAHCTADADRCYGTALYMPMIKTVRYPQIGSQLKRFFTISHRNHVHLRRNATPTAGMKLNRTRDNRPFRRGKAGNTLIENDTGTPVSVILSILTIGNIMQPARSLQETLVIQGKPAHLSRAVKEFQCKMSDILSMLGLVVILLTQLKICKTPFHDNYKSTSADYADYAD